MLTFILLFSYLCVFAFILGMNPIDFESRPTLESLGLAPEETKKKNNFLFIFRKLANINKPLCTGAIERRLIKDLRVAHLNITPEEFMLIKELLFVLAAFILLPVASPDIFTGVVFICLCIGFVLPEVWLKSRIKKVKETIKKELPDAIDLLGLCVNAGLDFMLSLKWVVEKSKPSVMIEELNTVLQEINVGKTRRDAIKDMANRYELPDLYTFARTLIQADKMGTSVTEAFNILSEDMRLARYRRGEQMALKAPMKMLIPLLFFIFPVVGVLVAGPILIDFMENNPFSSFAGK